MKFLDFEAGQVDKSFNSIALTHAGFLAALGGLGASMLNGGMDCRVLWVGVCMVPFGWGLAKVFGARQALIKSLRKAAKGIIDDKKTPVGTEPRGLGDLDASEVWAVAFPKSFNSTGLETAKGFVAVGIIVVIGVGWVKFIGKLPCW